MLLSLQSDGILAVGVQRATRDGERAAHSHLLTNSHCYFTSLILTLTHAPLLTLNLTHSHSLPVTDSHSHTHTLTHKNALTLSHSLTRKHAHNIHLNAVFYLDGNKGLIPANRVQYNNS